MRIGKGIKLSADGAKHRAAVEGEGRTMFDGVGKESDEAGIELVFDAAGTSDEPGRSRHACCGEVEGVTVAGGMAGVQREEAAEDVKEHRRK